ncbi:MAG: DUF3570 domain-containing protein [Myxococcales bacterium]|nr:DUF3570 domain-containing protein [Myxococcales bacterium]
MVCAFLIPAVAAMAQADGETQGRASLGLYADDDRVTVWSPTVSASTGLGSAQIDANASVDVVSAASVDVVTSASPGTVSERRVQLGATLRHPLSDIVQGRTLVIGSTEKDYHALRAGLGTTAELADRNFTVDVQVLVALDRVTSTIDNGLSESRRGALLDISLTQILDPRTYLDLILEGRSMVGYHASPYRTVPIRVPQSTGITRLPEATPEIRMASAARVRVRRAILDDLFLHVSYRYYLDDWEIDSHTVYALLLWQAAPSLRVGGSARGYLQSAASFHSPRYLAQEGDAPRFRTADRLLGAMDSWQVGLTTDYAFLAETRVTLNTSVQRFAYRDSPAQTHRWALRSSLGFEQTF